MHEVASHAAVSHHEADQALRRFPAAGIVTRLDLPGRPHRYRWTLEMGHLADGTTTSGWEVVDPVCGMPVPADSPHIGHDVDLDVRFCSLACLVRWNATTRKATRARVGGESAKSRWRAP